MYYFYRSIMNNYCINQQAQGLFSADFAQLQDRYHRRVGISKIFL